MKGTCTIDRKPPGARGHIDHSITIWIIVILGAIAGWKYLEMTGALPAGWWDRVPAVWKWLLAATGILAVAGFAALLVAGRVQDGREPYRVEAQGARRLIHETVILERTLGTVLLAAGAVFLGFGIATPGWLSWLILALGLLFVLFGVVALSTGRRYVVENGRLAAERGALGAWRADWSRSWQPGNPPRLEIRKGELTGGWGRYEFIPDAVLVDGEALGGNTRDARRLLPLLQQAIEEMRV